MKQLTVFAMTKKGYAVVKSISSRYPGMIDKVIAARDAGMAEDYYDELNGFCINSNIDFFDRDDSYSISTEYSIGVSWRWLIKAESSRLIVFHDSLLPRYRGFNPLVTALMNGDNEIGVTALYATQDYDRGDIIARSASPIQYPITIREAIETVLKDYSSLALEIAKCLSQNKEPVATSQSEAHASYSLWRDEEDYFIDWTASASTIKRFVDAVGFPYKGAASVLDGKVVRILKAEALDDVCIQNRTPGKIIFVHDCKPVVVCGVGLLRMDEVTDVTGSSIIPLPRFRMRFKGFTEQ